MKILKDYHIHTVYSDGINTPEEIILYAIEKGIKAVGFSDHSYTFFDTSYCVKKDKIKAYREEITALKEKYTDKISVLLGIEQDFYSKTVADSYDFVIGSVHYIKAGGKYLPVDENAGDIKKYADTYFGGDIYAVAEKYFKKLSKFADRKTVGIIGHFDLITKFDNGDIFDEDNPRFIKSWKTCADKLIKAGKIIEINTGALARGIENKIYPSKKMREYMQENGAKFLLSSDSHKKETLCFYFDKIDNAGIIDGL